jgi:flagellar hook-associated protein 2
VGLRFDPVGGGQLKQAVQQIIEAETQPLKAIQARKAKEDTRLKLFQEFKGKFSGLTKAISDMSTFRKFRELKVDLGDGANIVNVTLDKEKAETGTYDLEINELAAKTSIISNGFENPDEPVLGAGFVTMDLQNGDTAEIYVDDEHSSLRGIATVINRQANSPVTAAVIRDEVDSEYPWKIIITGKKDGSVNQMDFPEFYFYDGAEEFYVDDTQDAKNASIVMNGFEIELQGNNVTDFLPGVNLHLKQARPGQPFTMTITEDYQKIAGKVKGIVDQMNGILQFITKQNTIDEKTDTTTTFAGDTSLQTIEYQIRNIMHQGFHTGDDGSGEISWIHMSDLGIEFDKSGQLAFKEEKFNKTLEKDFNSISEAIIGPYGFIGQLRGLTDNFTRPGNGVLSIKEQTLKTRIKDIDNQIDQKTRIIERKKQDVIAQFSRLEATLGGLQRQQQYLSATLPGGGGGNMVSQLLG